MEQSVRRVKRTATLIVMEQNPADSYHWSKRVIEIGAGEFVDILAVAVAIADAQEAQQRDGLQKAAVE